MKNENLYKEIQEIVKKCYSCNKCTSGCPVAPDMDFPPSLIMRALALGQVDKILKSKTIWVCSSCQTCYSRCPFDVDIPRVIDLLKEYAYREKLGRKEMPTRVFHKVFLSSVKRFGRIYEAGFIGEWKLFSGKWFSDLLLGAKMFKKGKLPILPEKIKRINEVKKLFK